MPLPQQRNMIFQDENDTHAYIKGDTKNGHWSIEKNIFVVPYHPKYSAAVECVVGVCKDLDKVLGIFVQIRSIKSRYKKEEYLYAIKIILSEMLLEKYFEIEDLEIPF